MVRSEVLEKTPVVWDDMILNFNMMFLNDTIALLWILSDDATTVAAMGFCFIHVASNSFYLDCGADRWVSNIPEATAGANFSRPGRTCNTPLPLSVSLSTTTSRPHRPTPSTHSRTSPLRKRHSCYSCARCSGRSRPACRTSTRSSGPTQPRLSRSPRAAPVATSVSRCCTCMSSDTVSGVTGCGPSRCSPGGAHSARSHVM
ncbi:hypothetical protein EDB83DRAFT_82461 [Lactarius deliciosus]|nr:hypothetical protein EDB83DRAFT_82461 [Lactarius deliciosus]